MHRRRDADHRQRSVRSGVPHVSGDRSPASGCFAQETYPFPPQVKASQTFQIPATAQAMLAARIDRLSPEDKRLLQAASVIGKDVPFGLLQVMTDEGHIGVVAAGQLEGQQNVNNPSSYLCRPAPWC